jgi:hypothetical protein
VQPTLEKVDYTGVALRKVPQSEARR